MSNVPEVTTKPKVSFIIPFYNKHKSIQKCLKSLYAQSLKEIEVIVVFDGEDEEGEKLVSKFKSKGVITLTIPHGGAPRARNEGAKQATGDFIVFWDADCYIESGAAEVWMLIFKKYPEIDFCYSGYKFHPEGIGAINSEPFDPWLLQVNNYITTMSPIRREKAPQWDESLKSLQDWDFWLTAVENGCKGYFNKGYAFKTDYPTKESISGTGCSPQNWLERLETVKLKHNIPIREVCVCSIQDRESGIMLAKMIDADYRDYPNDKPNRYKIIIQIGFNPEFADQHARNFVNGNQVNRILFWRSEDVYMLRSRVSIDSTAALSIALNGSVTKQYCNDFQTKKKMESMGFSVEVLPLPIDTSKIKVDNLPEKLKIIIDVNKDYKEVFEHIQRSCPDIEFHGFDKAKDSSEYTAMIHFHPDRSMDMNVKKMFLNGRYVISNIQQPHCGYISDIQDVENTRSEIIGAIRNLESVRTINQKAIDYYFLECSPLKFKEVLGAL